MIGYHALVAALRDTVVEVSVDEVAEHQDEYDALIDIREPQEVVTGHLPGAVLVPRGVLEGAVERLDRSARIVLYCSGGSRSILAASSLQSMGFTAVASMAGGSTAWRMAGHPVVMPGAGPVDPSSMEDQVTADGAARHARHLALPEIGPQGQEALAGASVLVVGAGGLGSPAALYLAAAGVGRIGIVDPDVVDVSNLQRQILHTTAGIGRPKVESATTALHRLDPGIAVEAVRTRVMADNVLDLIAGYDLVIDASDNFPTRYLLNDAVLHSGTPLIHGSVFRFEGQVSVFTPDDGPCYRCLFPSPPPPELAPDCATAGVLGAVTGIVGSIQATEAIKVLLGIGDPLVGVLLTVEALGQQWQRWRFERNPDCPACGDSSRPPTLVDYDDACRPVAGG